MEKITDRRAVILALAKVALSLRPFIETGNFLEDPTEKEWNCLDPLHPEPGINEVVKGSGKGNQNLDVHDVGSGSK